MDPYANTATVGLSLWLVPSEPARTELELLISRLGRRLGCPPFAPHVTVAFWDRAAPPAAIEAAAAALARETRPVDATLVRVAAGCRFFQCVLAHLGDSAELRAPNAAVQRAFGTANLYEPHLSLVYGDLPDATRRAVALEAGALLAGRALTLDRLQLWDTRGPVDAWALLRDFDLQGGGGGGGGGGGSELTADATPRATTATASAN